MKRLISLVAVLAALTVASFGGDFGGFSVSPGNDEVTVVDTGSLDVLESTKGFHW